MGDTPHTADNQRPFQSLPPAERRRAQERHILNLVYDGENFDEITDRERPDFSLRYRGQTPFGVEITQLFPNESIARFNLIDGYADSLWSGGGHRHRDDLKRLTVVKLQITDPSGEIKGLDVPGIISETPSSNQFREELARAIRSKTDRHYQAELLTHINLIIMDWFHMPFDGTDYSSSHFLDDQVREALLASQFDEIFLVVYDTQSVEAPVIAGNVRPIGRVVRLQQLLLAEQYFLTGKAIDRHRPGLACNSVAHLAELIAGHITADLRIGKPVMFRGSTHVAYGNCMIGLSDSGGMTILDLQDYRTIQTEVGPMRCQLPAPVEDGVMEFVRGHSFGLGYAPRTRS